MESIYLAIPMLCLFAACIAGFGGSWVGRSGSHVITIVAVTIACILSCWVFIDVQNGNSFNGSVYTWAVSGSLTLEIGFLIDQLSTTMMVVVTFVSLMVHIYTIGYMHDDPGYQRFFSYISLFTFAMLMLVMANNFLQLFFGWEAVGLVSYLLIGFWFKRPSAVHANLKAFLVNRVGDFGMLLGIATIFALFGSLNYTTVFAAAPDYQNALLGNLFNQDWNILTVICLLLFVGAMGKSAQVPLHVWLPDSMEGPTPISALIHAATMVTAGIFMVGRMSPLFELSEAALSTVLVIGAITAFFMGLVGLVQNDIKRVVAYSTLSQLGYMTVALGASAYSAAIFHLATHAFFKALLFLAAGSVIIALHHQQDMRKMGGLRYRMPITYWTTVIGSLALVGMPPFAGFFSKESIIAAVQLSTIAGSDIAYLSVLSGVFITALYSFRLLFMTFHGSPQMSDADYHHVKESPKVVTIPLIILAFFSIVSGFLFFEPALLGGLFGDTLSASPEHDVVARLLVGYQENSGISLIFSYIAHGVLTLPFLLTLLGILTAWYCYLKNPAMPEKITRLFSMPHRILLNKYGFDDLYQTAFATGAIKIGKGLWRIGDQNIIDGFFVNGTAYGIGSLSSIVRRLQSGYLYHYAFAMIIGLFVALSAWIFF